MTYFAPHQFWSKKADLYYAMKTCKPDLFKSEVRSKKLIQDTDCFSENVTFVGFNR